MRSVTAMSATGGSWRSSPLNPHCLLVLFRFSFVRRRIGSRVGLRNMRRPDERGADEVAPHEYEAIASRRVFEGRVAAMRSDQVAMPGGVSSQRDVVELPGAVAIVALDEHDRVLLVRQYRHPVRRRLWEIPAGLLDSPRESAFDAGERELFEEGHVRAA